MTTPVGVSATSHFNASASVDKYTRIRCTRQTFSYFFEKIKKPSNFLRFKKPVFAWFLPKVPKKAKILQSLCTVHNF